MRRNKITATVYDYMHRSHQRGHCDLRLKLQTYKSFVDIVALTIATHIKLSSVLRSFHEPLWSLLDTRRVMRTSQHVAYHIPLSGSRVDIFGENPTRCERVKWDAENNVWSKGTSRWNASATGLRCQNLAHLTRGKRFDDQRLQIQRLRCQG